MSAPAFPFTALVGQERLREALLACAVDPGIGGVLVRGERGTAKSTAVRALAPLLPAVEVIEGCGFAAAPGSAEAMSCPDGPHNGSTRALRRPVRLVELPVGATADRLVGTLDLEQALAGSHAFKPGLLAAAHRGILYVDEVNLLPDHLVDVLLDAAAMGRNHVERDGFSASHAARFLLVGTMNPEEGELRPQLLDRFGLSVEVTASTDPVQRAEVVRRRLAHDADPAGFARRYEDEERALRARVAAARERLAEVRLPERSLLLIAGMFARLGVDGMRADIVCARTALALAALDGAPEVSDEHISRAAALVLGHRRRRGPLEAPGIDPGEIEQALSDAAQDAGQRPPDDDPSGGPGGSGGAGGQGSPGSEPSSGAGPSPGQASSPTSSAPAPAAGSERRVAPDRPGTPPAFRLEGQGRGPAGRRSASRGREGHPIDARAAGPDTGDLAVAATLRAAAGRRARDGGARALVSADLREHIRAGRESNLVVFCVDASGSMGARRRMSAVKGAILGLLLDAYQRRDRVALVTFRGDGAELRLPPTGSVERAAALLAELPTGGGTPLAAGLQRARELIAAERRRAPERRALALVVTDGRASGGPSGLQAALTAIQGLASMAERTIVFDAEDGRVRLGLAGALAAAAGADLLPLAALNGSGGRGESLPSRGRNPPTLEAA